MPEGTCVTARILDDRTYDAIASGEWRLRRRALVRSDALFAILAFAFVGGDGVENGILHL